MKKLIMVMATAHLVTGPVLRLPQSANAFRKPSKDFKSPSPIALMTPIRSAAKT